MIGSRASQTRAFGRRHAAILIADVAGYARLIERDEAGTFARTGRALNEVLGPCIAQEKGELLQSLGDSALALFDNAAAALRAALAIQTRMAERNGNRAPGDMYELRIGLNVGQILIDRPAVAGTAVNIAARLEALAEPGGILMSQAVYEQARPELQGKLKALGAIPLKNIRDPVAALSLPASSFRSRSSAKLGRSAGPVMLHGATVAVLPFRGLDRTSESEIVGQLVGEGITCHSCRFRTLSVVPFDPSHVAAGSARILAGLARDLGVRYIVTGSVHREHAGVGVTAKIVDTQLGRLVWGHQFRSPSASFDDLTRVVAMPAAAAIANRLAHLWSAELLMADLDNLDVAGRVMRAGEIARERTRDANEQAVRDLQMAIEIDPTSAIAHATLSRQYLDQVQFAWAADPNWATQNAIASASAAVRFDPDDARNHSALGFARLWSRDVSGAKAQLEHARIVNPADPDILADLADTLVYASMPTEALSVLDTAFALNPYGYDQFAWLGAGARYSLHDYRGVIETAERMTDSSELDRLVAASHAQLGEHSEARVHARRVLERNPGFRVSAWCANQPDSDPAEVEHLAEGLVEAGLPH